MKIEKALKKQKRYNKLFIIFMFFLFSGRKKVQIVLRFNLAKKLFIDIFLQSTNNDMDLYIIEFGG